MSLATTLLSRPEAPGALTIDIWSDVACPWCWVGKRHVEAALSELDLSEQPIEIHWRAFELNPGAVRERKELPDYVEALAIKYHQPRAFAEKMIGDMVARGKELGIDFNFDVCLGVNTFDAHRLLALAGKLAEGDRGPQGMQSEVKERLFSAYFTEGRSVADHDVLIDIAGAVGIDVDRARSMLASDELADVVRGEERLAAEYTITGVPMFMLAGRYGIPGAQPPEVILKSIGRALELEREREPLVPLADGPVCGPDGC